MKKLTIAATAALLTVGLTACAQTATQPNNGTVVPEVTFAVEPSTEVVAPEPAPTVEPLPDGASIVTPDSDITENQSLTLARGVLQPVALPWATDVPVTVTVIKGEGVVTVNPSPIPDGMTWGDRMPENGDLIFAATKAGSAVIVVANVNDPSQAIEYKVRVTK